MDCNGRQILVSVAKTYSFKLDLPDGVKYVEG